jgi:hypothetical protein
MFFIKSVDAHLVLFNMMNATKANPERIVWFLAHSRITCGT